MTLDTDLDVGLLDLDPDLGRDVALDLEREAERWLLEEAVRDVGGERFGPGLPALSVQYGHISGLTEQSIWQQRVEPSNAPDDVAGLTSGMVRRPFAPVERVDAPGWDPEAGPLPPEDPEAFAEAFARPAVACPRCDGEGVDPRPSRTPKRCRRCAGVGLLRGAGLRVEYYDSRDPTVALHVEEWGPGQPRRQADPVDLYALHVRGEHLRERLTLAWVVVRGRGRIRHERVWDRLWRPPTPWTNGRPGTCEAIRRGRPCGAYVAWRRGYLVRREAERLAGRRHRLICAGCAESMWPGIADTARSVVRRESVYDLRHGRIRLDDLCPCGSGERLGGCCAVNGAADVRAPEAPHVVVRDPLPSVRRAAIHELRGEGVYSRLSEDREMRPYVAALGARARVVEALRSDMANPAATGLARRIGRCRRWWSVAECGDCRRRYDVAPTESCGKRICPLCNRARQRRARARLYRVLEVRENTTTAKAERRPRLEHWVATMSNVTSISKGTWRGMHRAVRRLWLLCEVLRPGSLTGMARFLEPSWNRERRDHHPHAHMLVECDGAFRQGELSDLWWIASRGRGYVFHVSSVRDRKQGRDCAIAEVSKGFADVADTGTVGTLRDDAAAAVNYMTDPDKFIGLVREIADPRVLLELHASLKGVRAMDFLGAWRGANRVAIEAEEAEKEAVTATGLGPCLECGHTHYLPGGVERLHGERLCRALRDYDRRDAGREGGERCEANATNRIMTSTPRPARIYADL